jgi:GTP-binding protein
MRKKSRIEDRIEKYSMVRALTAVDKADVCVILIDATVGVTEQDTRVAGVAHDSGKACIIAINKWDLIDKQTGTLEEMTKIVKQRLPFMDYAPVLFISAKTGQRVDKLFALIKTVYENSKKRLTTSVLNKMISEAVTQVPTPQDKGRHLKIYYGTQVSVQPPTFALFVNDKELSHFSYERYLENQLRRNFGFEGVPIRLLLRNKSGEED